MVLDNRAHASVGGQPTASSNVDLPGLALANGYRQARQAATAEKYKRLKAEERRLDSELKAIRWHSLDQEINAREIALGSRHCFAGAVY